MPASGRSSATAMPTPNGSRRTRSRPTTPTSGGCGRSTSPPTTGSSPWRSPSRGPQFTTLDITEDDLKVARELGIRITVHVGDGLWGMSKPLMQMNARGLLGDDITYVHCNTIGDDEFKLIGDTGGTASIAPELEMQMGHGLPPALKMLAVGVRPSISIDVVTTVPADMFGAMRALLAGTRLMVHMKALAEKRMVEPLPLTSRDVLEFATLAGRQGRGPRPQDRQPDAGQGGRHRPHQHRRAQPDPGQQSGERGGRVLPISAMSTASSSPARRRSGTARCSASISRLPQARRCDPRRALRARRRTDRRLVDRQALPGREEPAVLVSR